MRINHLDEIDRKILDMIQTDFPLVSRPYARIGETVGISEQEACDRISKMRKNRVIRRLGANFQSSGLGYVSTLCAAKVPPDKMDVFVYLVNGLEAVTHNYERTHEWNVWFTIIAPSREEIKKILTNLSAATNVEIMELPATKLFKIKVDFPMGMLNRSSNPY